MKPRHAVAGLALLGLTTVLYFIRPLFQPVVYFVLYHAPVFITYGSLALVLYIGAGVIDNKYLYHASQLVVVFGIAISIISLTGVVEKPYVANEVQDRMTTMDELVDTDTNNPRIVPRVVAQQYAENTLQTPRYTASDTDDITVLNGTPHWSFGLVPDTTYHTFLGEQQGSIFVDMTDASAEVKQYRDAMPVGMGMGITDNYLWQLRKDNYLVDHRDPFMVRDGNDTYIAVPYVQHEWKFKAIIPFTVPRFAGVHLIDEDGTIEDLSKQEALNHPVLEGQNIYPYDLSRYYVDSLKWENGIINRFIQKQGVFQFSDIPGQGNEQPFTVMTEGGKLDYFLTVGPRGQGSGVYKVFTVDGRTGAISVYDIGTDNPLYGPAKAQNLVQSELSRVNWQNFMTTEPLPVVIDGTFYWQIRMIPKSGSDVSTITFVNAGDRSVTSLETREEVMAFLNEADVPVDDGNQTVDDGNETTTDTQGEIVIMDRDSDETVETYNLSNYTVRVR